MIAGKPKSTAMQMPWQYSASFLNEILDTQNDLAALELDRELITNLVAERSQKLTSADGASVHLVDDDALCVDSATGIMVPFKGRPVRIEASLVGRALQTGEVQYCRDTEVDEWADREVCRAAGVRSILAVPLVHGVQVIGVLAVMSRRTRAFEPGHISALRLMVGLVVAALTHAREFEIKRQLLADRTAAMAALRDTEQEFQWTFEMVGAGKAQVDLRTGRLLRCNEKFAQITGYSVSELAKMSFAELIHSEDVATAKGIADRMLRGEVGEHFLETRYVRKDGATIWVSLNVAVIKDDAGRPLKAMTTIQDITEKKRAQWLEEDRRHVLEMIARDLPLADVLPEIILAAERQIPAAAACVMVLQDGEISVFGPYLPEDFLEAIRQRCLALGVALSCGIDEASHRCGVTYPDTDDPWQDFRALAAAHAMCACWTMAVHAKDGSVAGLLAIFSRQRREPTSEELGKLELACNLATISIEHHNTIRQLAYMVRHDSLTGLANRVMAEDRLQQALAMARRSGKPVGLMALDIDRFKSINDTLGHHAGDSLLQQFAMRFNRRLRESDTLARHGGDEFVVILPQVLQREDCATVAEKLIACLVEPFQLGECTLRVTCSIGIALFPDDADDSLSLHKKADAALYRAKAKGRDRYSF
jgi:diguanylate cyclase (GGDEF)-like protein/PAS domain S-box-containing protein